MSYINELDKNKIKRLFNITQENGFINEIKANEIFKKIGIKIDICSKLDYTSFLNIFVIYYCNNGSEDDFKKGIGFLEKNGYIDLAELRKYCCNITNIFTENEFDYMYKNLKTENDSVHINNL